MESKDRRQIRAILDCSPRSTVRMYEICDMLDEDWVHCYVNGSAVLFVAWAVMLWAKNKEDLVPLLGCIPTDQEVDLFCVENRFIRLLERHVAPVTISAKCHAWSLDRLVGETPTLDSLTVKDTQFVNDHWDYKSEDSQEFIRHCIESFPTSCIRNQHGQPIAMAFCYGQSPRHLNMGGFKVLPEYRNQGLGKKIHLDMCKKVLARGCKPLVHIKIDNTTSQHICQNTGFRRRERVFWGRFDVRK